MPFPFLPAGAVLALAVLVGAFALFGLALRGLDRAATSARHSIAPGLVAGLRQWSHPRQEPSRPVSSSPAAPDADIEEVAAPASVTTQPVHRRR